MTSWGRRPCLLFSTLVCLGSAIWRARADSYGSFMGACVYVATSPLHFFPLTALRLNGFAAGPAETVQPVVIADVIFLHERGAYNALYFATYFISLMVGPIVGGAMAENVGWRNFWWLNVALNGVALLCCLFLFPETRFHRPMGGRGEGKTLTTLESPSNAGEEIALGDGKDVIVATNTKEITDIITNDTEKAAPAQPLSPTPSLSPILGSGRPSKQQWALFQPFRGALLSEFLLPWKLLLFPIVLLASFTVSWSASVFLMTNLTQSQVFAAPPYNFSSQTVGFFNFATLAGALVGLFTAGPLSDHVAEVLTRRNGGVREPEMRLLAAVPYVVVMIVGNVVVAMGYEQKWPWEVSCPLSPLSPETGALTRRTTQLIVILGYTFIGIQVTALPSIFSTYAVDSYKPVAGAIFVAITVNKNVWGYGFSRFVTPWSQQAGYVAPILTNMALVTLWCGCGVVFWFQGKTFRRWTRESDVHVERSG